MALVSGLNNNYHITSVSPTLISNDGTVIVSFHTTSVPAADDWIGAYSPPPSLVPTDSNYIFNTVPVKYGYCTWSSGDYLNSGMGSLLFNLTNLRANVTFYYLNGGNFNTSDFSDTVVEAVTDQSVSFTDVNQPLRNRVVPNFDTNIYDILWSAAMSHEPQVRWSFTSQPPNSPDTYTNIIPATVSNISRASMCGAPANTSGWRELGNIYTSQLTGIANMYGKYLYYIFGDASTNTWSTEVKFLVAPKAGTTPVSRGTRIVLLADMGVGSSGNSLQTCKFIIAICRIIIVHYTVTWEDTSGEASYNTSQSIVRLLQNSSTDIDAVFLSGKCQNRFELDLHPFVSGLIFNAIVGDLSYADGYLVNWDFFMDMIAPVAGMTALAKCAFLKSHGDV
jgi:hypothetical protein